MDTKVYRCFIASPGDTASERETCDKVFNEINRAIGDRFNFRIESLKWENDTRPAFGESSQGVINEQLGDDYDLFIGIMYKKFGTSTKNAGSGTEEEFNNAYTRLKNGEAVQIMFYFNDAAPSSMNEVDPSELRKVRDFRKKIETLDGYYFSFSGTYDFETKLRNHLNQHFLSIYNDADRQISDTSLKGRISNIFQKRLDDALSMFSDQPIIWDDPVLSNSNEISHNPDDNFSKRIYAEELITRPQSTIIKSPPQFGLTCLSHYLVKKAWDNGHLWLYVDSSLNKAKPHKIEKIINKEINELELSEIPIDCIVLDEWDNYEQANYKVLKTLIDTYKDIPIFVMQTIDDSRFFVDEPSENIDREFTVYHLLALPQSQIRKVVSKYNKIKDIGDENIVLTKIVSDLETLNIHRTYMNCLTLLKVAESHFDESPVNRTQMLEMVLFALFNLGKTPTYGIKPDLKDCEYVLGRYCESLIRKDYYAFTKDLFIEELEAICKEQFIDLQIDVVFDILLENSIITYKGYGYAFRASFWVYYFGAKRMHSDPVFAKYIFDSKKYIIFPEIIEFYTGIDRSRVDALEILSRDMESICNVVHNKVRLPEGMNPYGLIQWHPTEEQIAKAQKDIGDNVMVSGLPESLKDQHADRAYNQLKPYDQSIHTFMEDYSVHNLMQNIMAASRALRNSDYVDPPIRKNILFQILKGWEEISKVLFALTPVLASRGRATFEGQGFYLTDDFGNTFEERIYKIIHVLPTNVVGFFKDDISSGRIGPLLYDQFANESNALIKHMLALLLIFSRPRGWKRHIENYIISIPKNSYYLSNTVSALRAKYRYDFASDGDIRDMQYLIKKGLAKHEFGDKNPGIDKIVRIPNSSLPKRENIELDKSL